MISIFEHPWLSCFFGDKQISALWSVETQIDHYRAFEKALALALETCGKVERGQGYTAAKIIENLKIDIDDLAKGSAMDGLPIPNFVNQLRTAAGDCKDAVHTGATSQDVLDTALVLTLRDASKIFSERLEMLGSQLVELRNVHGSKHLMGRTRMQAALPITVGNRIESWHSPVIGHLHSLQELRHRVERLQFGGAVGNRNELGEYAQAIVDHMSQQLGLTTAPAWHSDRTRLTEYANWLSATTGSLGKLGKDITLMSQQGINEIDLKIGGRSSVMPHKSNPVMAELLITLAHFNATQLSGAHHALVHEQERSGAAWMLEWMILPPMVMATARALSTSITLLSHIKSIGSDL